jgi:predicted nucleic acid-binding Zn ribbon protein
MFKKRVKKGKHKFCPACGTLSKLDDAYCISCGYAFTNRKHKGKGIKWRNLLFITLVLVMIYIGIRFANGQPILPESIANIFNVTKGNK